ncbi:MAG: general secretion pathway protein GspK, partial [Armatimonadetes bacterium]|nr:general secretion pathway protein GspK [Armatimonadota bacterium]
MRRTERGMALVAALWILAVLLVLVTGFALAVQTEASLAGTYTQRAQAAWLAEAGLQRAFVEIRDHADRFTPLHEDAQEGEPLVLHLDSQDENALSGDEGQFEVKGYDEAARVNLNTVDEDTLRRALSDDTELVDTILDWRDDDTVPRDAGAETDFYAGLGDPYNSRDSWFQTVRELLLLRDMTPERYFGTDRVAGLDETPAPSGAQTPQTTPLDDQFTVYSQDQNLDADGQERVNLTTADRDTLQQALGEQLAPEDIDAILQYRDGQGTTPQPEQGTALPTPGSPAAPAPAPEQNPANPGAAQATRPASVAELLPVLGREKLQEVYDKLTVSTDKYQLGLVNVNTASAEVLASLPGMDEDIAQAIVNGRRDQPFETVGDLLGLSDMTDQTFEEVAPLLTTRALAYRLQADGTVGRGEHVLTNRIEAIVIVEMQPSQSGGAGQAGAPADAGSGEPEGPQRSLRLIYRRME